MKALVVYAHPNPVSFVAAVVTVVEEEILNKGAEVRVKDLYGMNFNPILKRMLSIEIKKRSNDLNEILMLLENIG
jgi:putative NADPH-quinone reductase